MKVETRCFSLNQTNIELEELLDKVFNEQLAKGNGLSNTFINNDKLICVFAPMQVRQPDPAQIVMIDPSRIRRGGH